MNTDRRSPVTDAAAEHGKIGPALQPMGTR
jgi:hypothetical protein